MNITENGKITNSYSYSMTGQIASSNEVGTDLRAVRTDYLWDGLALLKRGTTEYVNEPAVTGGNPILANGKGLFNDMLGNSLGVAEKDKFTAIKRDAFGKTLANPAGNAYNMFTGKPQIGGLGYAFLFRNYRSDLGKWQTSDPLGYPDGLNNLAYCNNKVTGCIDWLGAAEKTVILMQNFTDETDIYFKATEYWLDYQENNPNVTIITYSSTDTLSSINQKLKTNSTINPIPNLYIVDHGSIGEQKLGNNALNASNMNGLFDGVKFSQDANVTFDGCSIAADSTKGREFASAASLATGGSTVTVAKGAVSYANSVRTYPASLTVSGVTE